jgi:hypothetical protein
MRDPDRIDPLLAQLAELWRLSPDLRLGQLLSNAAYLVGGPDLRVIEDDRLLTGLAKLRERIDSS